MFNVYSFMIVMLAFTTSSDKQMLSSLCTLSQVISHTNWLCDRWRHLGISSRFYNSIAIIIMSKFYVVSHFIYQCFTTIGKQRPNSRLTPLSKLGLIKICRTLSFKAGTKFAPITFSSSFNYRHNFTINGVSVILCHNIY